MGAAGSKLEKALGDQFPEGERYFGLENFGNTCYCNSVLQVFSLSPLLWILISLLLYRRCLVFSFIRIEDLLQLLFSLVCVFDNRCDFKFDLCWVSLRFDRLGFGLLISELTCFQDGV